MSLTLYAPLAHLRAAKIEIFAHYANIPLQLNITEYTSTKTSEYLALHPLGKIPLLNTPEGPIYESNAILRYLARRSEKGFGTNNIERAHIDQWLQFQSTQLDSIVFGVLTQLLGYTPADKEKYSVAKKELREVSKTIDNNLKQKKFLVGETLSIADLSIATLYFNIFRLVFDQKTRQSLPNLTRWYENISSLPSFVNYYGRIWLCQKQFEPNFSKQQKKEQPKKEQVKQVKKEQVKEVKKEQKKTEPKKTQKKKQEKKPEPPKKQAKKQTKKEDKKKKKDSDEQSQQEEVVQQKKKVNPLDLLPKSTFILDDFKRQISNTADKPQVLKNFWAKYDPAGWSIWKVKYQKYEGQGVVGYLTANLKNGYLRNIDHFRKYSFAAVGVYGVEGNYEIQGVWLWRGTEIPEEWKEHQSYDYHVFTRLDHTNENDRNLLEQYWLNLDEGQSVEGLPIFEAKYFK